MPPFNKIKISAVAIFIVVISCLAMDIYFQNFKKQERVIEWDIHSYYAYLPATFIYKDIKLEKSDYFFGKNYALFWPSTTEDGKKVIKTSMGMAILYAPFFFVGHTIAVFTDYPDNGYSEPYKLLLLLSAIFYLIVGLDFVRKTLNIFNFSDKQIAITLLLIGMGTNLLCYSSLCGTMSHVYSFCLFAMFIYYSIKWHEQPSLTHTLFIGFLFGIISLVRPTNGIIGLLFLLYGISNWQELKARVLFFLSKFKLLLLIVFCIVLVWLPQIAYWKIVTGHFFYYSYIGERFFFDNPKIIDGLFSFRKGWLLYTPMMAFALLGIPLLRNELKKIKLPIVLFVLLNIYIIFSWWCWWYGGSYGQRSMVDSYSLLAIPLACVVKFIDERKLFMKTIFYVFALFFSVLNIFQTFQLAAASLHYDGMTAELYFKQFGKIDMIENFEDYMDPPNYEEALRGNRASTTSHQTIEMQTRMETPLQNIMPPISNNFTKTKEIERKQVFIKAYNNLYVCAEGKDNMDIYANKEKPSTWETYYLILFENNQCALLSFTNNFLCTELNNQTELSNTRCKVESWETFTIVKIDDTHVAFKAFNGNYLTVDDGSKRVFARSKDAGEHEKFEIINVPVN